MSWALRGQLRTRWWNGTAGFSANVMMHSSTSLPGWSKQFSISSSLRPTFFLLSHFILITFLWGMTSWDLVEHEMACSWDTPAYYCSWWRQKVLAMVEHLTEALTDFFIEVHLEGKYLSEWLRVRDINATREISLPGLAVRLVCRLLQKHSRKHGTTLESSTGINMHSDCNWDRPQESVRELWGTSLEMCNIY